MYKIIGGDGVEYGPITAEQVRLWISQRRLNAQSRIKPAEAADWTTLGQLPEFADALAAPMSPPPTLTPAPSTGGTPDSQAKTSRLAIAALVLGILGIFSFGLTAIGGLVCGIVGLVKINASGGKLRGKGLAISSIVVSGVVFLLIPIIAFMAALLLPALSKAKAKAESIRAVSCAKQLALGVRLYATDHNDQFPPAETWSDAILNDVGSEKTFQVPSKPGLRCAFAFNARVGGLKEGNIPPGTVLFFESDQGWNASGGPEIMIKLPRKNAVFVVAFADGSVKQLRADELASLRWNP